MKSFHIIGWTRNQRLSAFGGEHRSRVPLTEEIQVWITEGSGDRFQERLSHWKFSLWTFIRLWWELR